MTEGIQVQDIPMHLIVTDSEFNCRGPISPTSVFELAESMHKDGLSQPVMVSPLREDQKPQYPGKEYFLVLGFRRYTAAASLQWKTIPAHVKPTTPLQAKVLNITENIHRTDLTYWQECLAVKDLYNLHLNRREISEALSKPPGWVQRATNVWKLPKEVQEMVELGILGPTHVTDLFKFEDPDELLEVARSIHKSYQHSGNETGFRIKVPKPKASKRNPAIIKKHRKAAEIVNFMRYMRDIGYEQGIEYRLLAWAAGTITDLEVLVDLKLHMKENFGVDIAIPSQGIPDMGD